MNIVLHIERLVVDGVPLPAGSERRLREEIASELSLLLGGGIHSSLAAGNGVQRVNAGTISPGNDMGRLARDAARAIFQGLNQPERR